jgi:hypothetical protein
MSTWSVVTHSATHLTAIQKPSSTIGSTHFATADVATINGLIINDKNTTQHIYQSFTQHGLLYVPNRGVLKVEAGDVVAVDINGWPILISAQSIAAGNAYTLT